MAKKALIISLYFYCVKTLHKVVKERWTEDMIRNSHLGAKNISRKYFWNVLFYNNSNNNTSNKNYHLLYVSVFLNMLRTFSRLANLILLKDKYKLFYRCENWDQLWRPLPKMTKLPGGWAKVITQAI